MASNSYRLPMAAATTLPFLIYLLLKFAIHQLEVRIVRLFERAICQKYYSVVSGASSTVVASNMDEAGCKVSHVQDELATIMGWKMLTTSPSFSSTHQSGSVGRWPTRLGFAWRRLGHAGRVAARFHGVVPRRPSPLPLSPLPDVRC